MGREIGTFEFPANFEVKKKGNLDSRKYCPTYNDMLALTSNDYIYRGMTVEVGDNNNTHFGLYILLDETNPSNPISWLDILTVYKTSTPTNDSLTIWDLIF